MGKFYFAKLRDQRAAAARRVGGRGRRLALERLEPRHVLSAANLQITEFMASNGTTLADGDGKYSDWIEIHNDGPTTVDLADYFLTDTNNDLTRWAFPSRLIGPDEYLVVFASAPLNANGTVIDNYVDAGGKLHTNFGLGAEGEYLALTYEDPATHAVSVVHHFAPSFPEQRGNISYGLDAADAPRYFNSPTPGTANGTGFVGFAADTQFSADRGFYDATFQLTISAAPGAQIYYTLNGNTPSSLSGSLYTGPITIDRTRVVRAVAYEPGRLRSNVGTETYLFVNDIVQQNTPATINMGLPSTWGGLAPDYGMDPDVIGNFNSSGAPIGGDKFGGIYAATIKNDLKSLPTLSIVMNASDMFGSNGIYTNSSANGDEWERATSVEWITNDGSAEFQINAGIQIQGGAFRSHSLTKKHSLRLTFESQYGPSTLKFPLFGEGAVDEFNTLVLRAGANDGYTWDAARFTEQYTRDEFGRSLQRAMGSTSAHGAFVHLYINGVYWGLYNPVERPDNEFAASYLGGEADNWDAIHVNEASEGDFTAWNAMLAMAVQAGSSQAAYLQLQGLTPNGERDPANPPLLDVENYIDYLLLNVWGGNWDWPFKNYWAGRDRSPLTTTGFQFFSWDFENTMGNNRSRSPLTATTLDQNFSGSTNVGQAHNSLKANAEYRLAFADRVHKFLFNDGVLTPAKLVERYAAIADEVDRAIVAESARWGDSHYSSSPLTLAEWTTERDWILNTYLVDRTDLVLQELKQFNLYPSTGAPVFNQFGGEVSSDFDLTMTAPAGTVYYTLDGSDPRLAGGELSPTAIAYTGPVQFDATTQVKARARVGSGAGASWSALADATFLLDTPFPLRITELHYHPAGAEEHEFIELTNTGNQAINLNGVSIATFASEPYVFADGLVLEAGERIVVARNPTDFAATYGTGINLAPTGYANANLGNSGESISLLGPAGELLQHFTYTDDAPWPTAADGAGPSLEYAGPFDADAADPMAVSGDPYDDPNNWRASREDGGSPGTDGEIPGDYDRSGYVDAQDYTEWKSHFGDEITPGTGADGNRNGVVDLADYTIWRNNVGAGQQAARGQAAVAVATPEAGSASLASGTFELAIIPFELSNPKQQDERVEHLVPLVTIDNELLTAWLQRRSNRGSSSGSNEAGALEISDDDANDEPVAAVDAVFGALGHALPCPLAGE